MRKLDEGKHLKYFIEASKEALKSNCHRSRCGSVIVQNQEIIGRGANTWPEDQPLEYCRKDCLPEGFKSDKTCCTHAEQNAIYDALSKHGSNAIKGSMLFFARIDQKGNPTAAGEPYCTICSKAALQVGIGEFVLKHETALTAYETEEYNRISFEHAGSLILPGQEGK